jgi:molybdopterin/thiamine biosynthesis adenylyltransferase
MSTLAARIASLAAPAGALRAISVSAVRALAGETGLSIHAIELAALEAHILPARYLRNFGTLGWEGQARLLHSCVAIIGAGGLGGWIIEGLARMGVGRLIVIDGDIFEDNNLNRQALCWESSLGQPKALAAAERVAHINAAVSVAAMHAWLTADNLEQLLAGAQIVVDALDKLPTRLMLQAGCAKLGIPLVHGAIGGYIGQVTTILPGDPGLRALYGDQVVAERGAEVEWGNPAATPMMIAAWEIHEVIKLLTGKGEILRGRLLFLDAEAGCAEFFELG